MKGKSVFRCRLLILSGDELSINDDVHYVFPGGAVDRARGFESRLRIVRNKAFSKPTFESQVFFQRVACDALPAESERNVSE